MKRLLSVLIVLCLANVGLADDFLGQTFLDFGARAAAQRAEARADFRSQLLLNSLDNLNYSLRRATEPPVTGVMPGSFYYSPPAPRQKWQRHYHMRDRRIEYQRSIGR